jgi:hypothetical protein
VASGATCRGFESLQAHHNSNVSVPDGIRDPGKGVEGGGAPPLNSYSGGYSKASKRTCDLGGMRIPPGEATYSERRRGFESLQAHHNRQSCGCVFK